MQKKALAGISTAVILAIGIAIGSFKESGKQASTTKKTRASVSSAEIRLTASEPSQIARTGWPVTSGVPLPRGALHDASHAALYDRQGTQLPLQTEALTR